MHLGRSTALALALLLALGAGTRADLLVNENLGTLGTGSYDLIGTTAGAGSEADYFAGLTNSAANWGNEYVYQFTVAQTTLVSLRSNALTGDPDFFLLDSLATTPIDGKVAATGGIGFYFLDGSIPQTEGPILVGAGTYYLAAASFIGFDGSITPGDADYNVTMILSEILPPSDFIDLGIVADVGEAFSLDTFGSGFDTELGLWDSAGFLLAINDDAGGTLQSLLDFAAGLPEGDYFLALGGWNTIYGDGFSVTGGSDFGDYVLNYPGGSLSGSLDPNAVQYFRLTVVPEPSSIALTGLGALGLLAAGRARRRS